MACFEDLPVEIIDLIFSQLFLPHDKEWSEYLAGYPRTDTKTLISLTATSKLCRSLALPILFYSIKTTHKRKYIFNMFNSYQDLAQYTKVLSLPSARPSDSDYSDVQDTASRLGVGGPVVHSVQEGRPQTSEMSLALSLFSRAERLKLHLPDHNRKNEGNSRSFRPTCDLFRVILGDLGRVPCLENLRNLEIFARSRGRFTPRLALLGIPLLLELTPKIEVLVLSSYPGKCCRLEEPFDVDICRPALENVIEIRLLEWPLTNRIGNDIDVFEQILAATTRFKKFVYVVEPMYLWDREYPPRRLISMLLPVQSTLQHLVLYYGKRLLLLFFDRGIFRPEEVVMDPDQLKPFTKLETLEISQCVYCHHQFDHNAEGATYLADLLPLTVKKLTIYFPRYHGGIQCMDCILHLGQRVVAGDFPALECLQINAHFHQHRRRYYRRPYVRWGVSWWTAEAVARETMVYDKKLAAAARREKGRERKVIEAFAGSGVEVRYNAWQTVDEDREFREFGT